jgi:hypothetical protein
MTDSQRIFELLSRSTELTASSIASSLKLRLTVVRNVLSRMKAVGKVTSMQTGATLTGAPIHSYSLVPGAAPPRGYEKRTVRAPKARVVSGIKSATPTEEKPIKPVKPTTLSVDAAIKSLAGSIVEQVLHTVRVELESRINELSQTLLLTNSPTPGTFLSPPTNSASTAQVTELLVPRTERPHKAHWLIVGLLAEQFNRVTADFPELSWELWKDGSNKQLAAVAKHADRVLLHTRHMSHSQQVAVKAATAAHKITYVNGGESEMRRVIRDVLGLAHA